MRRRVAAWLVGLVLLGAGAVAGELEAGFRKPPADCQPTVGWFHSRAFEATLASCPPDVRAAFDRALADGGLSTTPEEVTRMAAWQALVDAGVLTQPGLPARPPAQPYRAFAGRLHAAIARIAFLCSRTKPEGGLFTQAKPAHGITLYPPAPDLYLARRRLGEADVYLAVSQTGIDTLVTITFPRLAAPELWHPDDGSIAEATAYAAQAGKTMLQLRLRPYQALFIVLRKPPSKQHVTFASSALEVTEVASDGSWVKGLARVNGRCSAMFADGTMGATKVEGLPEPLPIESGWTMRPHTPTKRGPVGIAAARVTRADADNEKPTEWAAPSFDDSQWTQVELGKPEGGAAPGGSPWKASWLTFQGNREQRLFRKVFELPERVELATVTATGDNGYELFVNGTRLGGDGDWHDAETYDAAKALHKGRNLIAVRNTNQGGIAGLLLEARVRLASGKLLTLVTDGTWKMTAKAPDGWQKLDFDDSTWGKPTVTGRPPIGPWGDVKGLPASPRGGQLTWYRFRLPPGARSVRLPASVKDAQLFVNGKSAAVRDGAAELRGPVPRAPLVAALRIVGPTALDKPLMADCGEGAVGLGPWLLIGYATYSGLAHYSVEVELPEAFRSERLRLDLGAVGCAAQVTVNGRDLGTRLWRPYTFDITHAVRSGKNAIEVTVANTAANGSGKDHAIERLAAGLIGPVRIHCLREVTIKPK